MICHAILMFYTKVMHFVEFKLVTVKPVLHWHCNFIATRSAWCSLQWKCHAMTTTSNGYKERSMHQRTCRNPAVLLQGSGGCCSCWRPFWLGTWFSMDARSPARHLVFGCGRAKPSQASLSSFRRVAPLRSGRATTSLVQGRQVTRCPVRSRQTHRYSKRVTSELLPQIVSTSWLSLHNRPHRSPKHFLKSPSQHINITFREI